MLYHAYLGLVLLAGAAIAFTLAVLAYREVEVGGKCLICRHVRGHGELELAFGTRGDDAAACPCDGNLSFAEVSFVEYVGAKRLCDCLCHGAAFCDYKYIIHFYGCF